MQYTFTSTEVVYCIKIGTQRQKTNERNRVPSKQFTRRDPTTIHIQGVLAEYAFAKICERECKVSLDIESALNNTKSRRGTDDWTIHEKRIDVKSTLHNSSVIYAAAHKSRYPSDLYVLIWIDTKCNGSNDEQIWQLMREPRSDVVCTFQGFATPKDLFANIDAHHCAANASWDDFLAQIYVNKNAFVVQ